MGVKVAFEEKKVEVQNLKVKLDAAKKTNDEVAIKQAKTEYYTKAKDFLGEVKKGKAGNKTAKDIQKIEEKRVDTLEDLALMQSSSQGFLSAEDSLKGVKSLPIEDNFSGMPGF